MELAKRIFTLNKRTIAVILGVTLAFASVQALSASTEAKTKVGPCLTKAKTMSSIKEVNGAVSVSYKLPKKCKDGKNVPKNKISLVVYKLNDGNWKNKINNQYIYKSQTKKLVIGERGQMTVAIPNCGYQADLVIGKPVDISTGAKQNPILLAKVGGNGVPCKKTPVTPTDPVTPDDGEDNTDVTVVEGGSVKKADELPNTGPGAVIATFAGVSSLSSFLYAVVARRFS